VAKKTLYDYKNAFGRAVVKFRRSKEIDDVPLMNIQKPLQGSKALWNGR
jgi:hypothetical protein